jgi:hypothetical protein
MHKVKNICSTHVFQYFIDSVSLTRRRTPFPSGCDNLLEMEIPCRSVASKSVMMVPNNFNQSEVNNSNNSQVTIYWIIFILEKPIIAQLKTFSTCYTKLEFSLSYSHAVA